MKLVILGNGFDLHHGLKTSFVEFRKFLLDSKKKSDLELVRRVDLILTSKSDVKISELLWNEYENIMGEVFSEGIEINNSQFDFYDVATEFSERFYEYLLIVNNEKKIVINNNIRSELESADCVLTFNFTDSYKAYIENPDKIPVFHIHGKLEISDLPIIGYYYDGTSANNSIDYLTKYNGKGFHKPALALRQNEINFEQKISKFKQTWREKFSEIVSIGYSFGESDSHIFSILDTVMLDQLRDQRIPVSKASQIPIISFKLFNFNQDETNRFETIITNELQNRHQRSTTRLVYGEGHREKRKELFKFIQIQY